MLLSDRDIRAEIETGALVIDPWRPAFLRPASIDLRLDCCFRVFDYAKNSSIDPSVPQEKMTSQVDVQAGEPLTLQSGAFMLGSTFEVVKIPNHLAARLEGKSSLGRLGLSIHATAGFIDPGFSGHITLELSNVANLPIILWPGMKIGQLCIFRLTSAAEHPYGGG